MRDFQKPRSMTQICQIQSETLTWSMKLVDSDKQTGK